MSELLLSAKEISKIYRRKGEPPITVLKRVDFDISVNDRIAILGKSGAGKSTLLHILGTLESPSNGSVYFRGKDIFALNEKELSRFRNFEIGFIFQFHYLMLEFTAVENVMMPALLAGESKVKARKTAEHLLARVELKDRLNHKPSQLSGGEQQRVAIARALMMKPQPVIIFSNSFVRFKRNMEWPWFRSPMMRYWPPPSLENYASRRGNFFLSQLCDDKAPIACLFE